MSFNRLAWFKDAVLDSPEAGAKDLVTTLAHLADEHGFVTQAQIEGFYEIPPGELDDFFQGGGSILLELPSARAGRGVVMPVIVVPKPVKRPNGKLYRPRKIRVVVLDFDYWEDMSCLVLGTHDVEAARELAALEIHRYDPGLHPGEARLGWWRQSIRNGDPYYDSDPERGAAGVSFDITEGGL